MVVPPMLAEALPVGPITIGISTELILPVTNFVKLLRTLITNDFPVPAEP